jgi:hypothetical protein
MNAAAFHASAAKEALRTTEPPEPVEVYEEAEIEYDDI